METRTAPQWIRDRETGYGRARQVWLCVNVLWLLGWLVVVLVAARWNAVRFLCAAAWVVIGVLQPWRRARRYGNAARSLNAAIRSYEAGPDQPESALTEADRSAGEALRLKRIRTAPAWIRGRRRRYRLRILLRGPAALVWALLMAAAGWNWPSHRLLAAVAAAAVIVGTGVWALGPAKASRVLSEAIERYEFESASTESELDEAGQRAFEILRGR